MITALLLLATLAYTPPRAIQHRVNPEYTEKARKAHISGRVRLDATVGTDGRVRDVKVMESLGYGLDEAAIKAVRTWEFIPATNDQGEPTIATIPIDCEFRML